MNQSTFHETHLSAERLRPLLIAAERLRVGVIGDFRLDLAWTLAGTSGDAARPVADQIAQPGGAGAVALAARALGARVEAFGLAGDDLFGHALRRELERAGVVCDNLLEAPEGWATPTSVRLHTIDGAAGGYDLGMRVHLPTVDTDALAEAIAARLGELDVVIISEQLEDVVLTPHLRGALQKLIARHGDKLFIADTRHFAEDFKGAMLRLGAHSAAAQRGEEIPAGMPVPLDMAETIGAELTARTGRPVFLTRGDRGVVVAAGGDLVLVPAIQVLGRFNARTAGETLTAALAVALASGHGPLESAAFGCLAVSVAPAGVGQAKPAALMAAAAEADAIYWPDLAQDARAARFAESADIEIVSDAAPPTRITHAIFDHDGTISTLRQGWEEIMEPMMVRAILGDHYDEVDTLTFQRVEERARDFIDKTTGIQTLIQMQGLAALVREYGFVPEERVLDEHGYKKIYNDELIRMVSARVHRLETGELEPHDFAMKGAIELLHSLRSAGVKLYLASGTDEPDVRAEAEAMGYADLFEGHIYGSIGDVTKDAKKLVLDRILGEIGQDAMAGVVTIGDGPVEIRETRRRGGFTIGVASDEVRRFGWNMAKRTRLVRAGADWIVPDFAQRDRLLALFNGTE